MDFQFKTTTQSIFMQLNQHLKIIALKYFLTQIHVHQTGSKK